MGGKKDAREGELESELRKTKEVCCEKYLKKGRRCKSCPDGDRPITQVEDEQK